MIRSLVYGTMMVAALAGVVMFVGSCDNSFVVLVENDTQDHLKIHEQEVPVGQSFRMLLPGSDHCYWQVFRDTQYLGTLEVETVECTLANAGNITITLVEPTPLNLAVGSVSEPSLCTATWKPASQ